MEEIHSRCVRRQSYHVHLPDFLGFGLAQYAFEKFLSYRQYKILQQTKPPKALEGEVSQEVFDKSQVSRDGVSIEALNMVSRLSRHTEEQRRSLASLQVSTA